MPIQVENLFYSYLKKTPQKVEALKGINLTFETGKIISLVGQTGSGKSTLVQCLNALVTPDEGTIKVDEFLVTNKKRKNKKIHELRKHVGLVFQFPEYQLFEESVIKDVAFGPKNYGIKNDEAIEAAKKALSLVGLNEEYYERSPFELSGGEKRRVAIAGILAINPDILVLDEPTAGLDPDGVNQILALIEKLNKEGKTIILVTHDMNIVVRLASRVVVLNNGLVAFDGTPFELFSQNTYGLEIPEIYQFVNLLNKKGYKIPLESIHQVDDLLPYLKGGTHHE